MALNAYQDCWDTVFVYSDGVKRVVPGYKDDLIAKQGVNVERPRRCYLDLELECDKWSIEDQTLGRAPLICWVVTDDDGNVFHGMGTDGWERRLVDTLAKYDQVCAWNGDHYDFLVLQNTVFVGRERDRARWLWLDQLKVFGRYHLSVESGAERSSLALGRVAQAVLGEGKHDINLLTADRETILRYCIQDARLLAKLEAKTKYIDLHYNICKICNCFPDSRSLNPTVFATSYLRRLAHTMGVQVPLKRYVDNPEPYDGAYVEGPHVKGIVEDVWSVDFASMYPSIMITYNMSWETVDRPGVTVPSTGVSFSIDKKGVIPTALERLVALRKTLEDESSKTACKAIVNSFYGLVGSPYSLFYNPSIARSVTATGEWLIKTTKTEAELMGYKVIYIDTDSNLMTGGDPAPLVRHCNDTVYPSILPNYNNTVKLAQDRHYKRIVFIAAKKYVGVLDNGKAHIKGLEYKRRDQCEAARELQKHIIDEFVSGALHGHIISVVLDWYKNCIEGKLTTNQLKISKRLTKNAAEYSVKPPHVRLADETARVGDRVEYVILNGKSPQRVVLAAFAGGAYDRKYYWNDVIFPPTKRLLEAMFPNFNWNEFLYGENLCINYMT